LGSAPDDGDRVSALVMRRTRHARARHHRVVVRVAIGLIALGLALAGGVAAAVAVFVRDPTTFVSCNLAAKHQRVLGQESFVRAADGSLLGAVPATWHRQPVALTARGRARIVQEPMARAPKYAAVAIDVEHIDDHRQGAFLVASGIDRRWVDEGEKRALGERVAALGEIAARDVALA
jgi:hypothetical protein